MTTQYDSVLCKWFSLIRKKVDKPKGHSFFWGGGGGGCGFLLFILFHALRKAWKKWTVTDYICFTSQIGKIEFYCKQ